MSESAVNIQGFQNLFISFSPPVTDSIALSKGVKRLMKSTLPSGNRGAGVLSVIICLVDEEPLEPVFELGGG